MSELYKDFTDKATELMRKADAGDAEAQHTFASYLLKDEEQATVRNKIIEILSDKEG